MSVKYSDDSRQVSTRNSDNNFNIEEEVSGKACDLCQDIPESIIYLSCDHVVCLICAAKLIICPDDETKTNLGEIICDVCGVSTELSDDVQHTLVEFLQSDEFEDIDTDRENSKHQGSNTNDNAGNSQQVNSDERSQINIKEIRIPELDKSKMNQSKKFSNHATPEVNNKEMNIFENKKKGISSDDYIFSNEYGNSLSNKNRLPCLKSDSPLKNSSRNSDDSRNNNKFLNNSSGNENIKDHLKISISNASRSNQIVETDQNQKNFKNNSIKSNSYNNNSEINQKNTQSKQVDDYFETRSTSSMNSTSQNFVLDMSCSIHISEKYHYYDPIKQKLFCPQCLIEFQFTKNDLSVLKPFKKCLPEILQNFQELITDVELTRSLLENKKKDFEIRQDSTRAQTYSTIKRVELIIDEFSSLLEELKNNAQREIENKSLEFEKDLKVTENKLNEQINYFGNIIEDISNKKQHEDNSEHEIFKYLLDHQLNIVNEINNNNKNQSFYDTSKQFSDFNDKLKNNQNQVIKKILEEIQKKTNALFTDICKENDVRSNGNNLNKSSSVTLQFLSQTQSLCQIKNSFSNSNISAPLKNESYDRLLTQLSEMDKKSTASRGSRSIDVFRSDFKKKETANDERFIYRGFESSKIKDQRFSFFDIRSRKEDSFVNAKGGYNNKQVKETNKNRCLETQSRRESQSNIGDRSDFVIK